MTSARRTVLAACLAAVFAFPAFAAAPAAQLVRGQDLARAPVDESASAAVLVTLVASHVPHFPSVDRADDAALHSLRTANTDISRRVASRIGSGGLRLRRQYENWAGFSADVTSAGLAALLDDPDVLAVEPVTWTHPHLRQGIPLINAANARSQHDGSGVSIAICDTGIDYTHPALGGGPFPNTKVVGGRDIGASPQDADPFPATALGALSAHGTACASIAAGSIGNTGDYIGGMAPGAKIYALKITGDSSLTAGDDDHFAAWDWCITHRNDDPSNPILVISTSFGGSTGFASACDASYPQASRAAAAATAAGISIFVSAGNDGFCNGITGPACLTDAIAVGAVYDFAGTRCWCVDGSSCLPVSTCLTCPDPSHPHPISETFVYGQIAGYSNSGAPLTLLAPASDTYCADIVGGAGFDAGNYCPAFGGTSAACPYAAGAAACLQSAALNILGRYLTPAEVRAKLTSTGVQVTDAKSGLARPRIDLGAAVASLANGQTPDLSLTKSGAPDTVTSGSVLAYTLTVANAGPGTATGVTLWDTLPEGVLYAGATASQGSCTAPAAGVVTCALGAIPVTGTATVSLTVTVTAKGGTLINTASVDADLPDSNPANNAAEAVTQVVPPAGCDLRGTWVSAAATCRGVCTIRGSYEVTNTCANQRNVNITVYVSDRPGLGAGAQVYQFDKRAGMLRANTARPVSMSLRLPRGVSAAGRYLVTQVDSGNAAAEIDEENNWSVAGPLP